MQDRIAMKTNNNLSNIITAGDLCDRQGQFRYFCIKSNGNFALYNHLHALNLTIFHYVRSIVNQSSLYLLSEVVEQNCILELMFLVAQHR